MRRRDCGLRGAQNLRPGPAGTRDLYTILAKFEEEQLIREVNVLGRKRTYRLTDKGRALYGDELERLRACIADAESEEEDET